MELNLRAVGATSGPATVAWNSRDVMLYALGVGAGQADPADELEFTTENTEGKPLRALPTFALVVAQSARLVLPVGNIDRTRVVHASQSLKLHRPLAVDGTASVRSTVRSIEDKGSGALITAETEATDPATGDVLFTATSASFLRGGGGFDPARRSAPKPAPLPAARPDLQFQVPTRADQALLYRLCADRNPLHSDPAFAARGGLARPILHGLCTYGSAARGLLREIGHTADLRLQEIEARFTKPVLPGATLTVKAWADGGRWRFQVMDEEDATVLDFGQLRLLAA